MEVLGLILSYGFNNTAIYVICILPVLQDCFFLYYQMCDWAANKNNDD